MTDLPKEQEAALVEGLEQGWVRLLPVDTRWTLLGHGLIYRKRGREDDVFELTTPARLLAQVLKERDETRTVLTLYRARLADIQRAMHSAGHKSAAAMLNPLLRGDDE